MTPSAFFVDVALAIAVLAAWLGTAGFYRLASPLDRLHCATFINVVAGGGILIAACLADGASVRVAKLVILILAMLLTGAAVAHATARALLLRRALRPGKRP